MNLLLPVLVFAVVFGGAILVSRRSQRTVVQLQRHRIAGIGLESRAAVRRTRTPILNISREGVAGQFAAKIARPEMRSKAETLLRQAGNPMPVGTYLLLRAVFTLGLTPFFLFWVGQNDGFSRRGIVLMVVGLVALPNLPPMYIKRKARKRSREIEKAMPDAMDLLVVCVEGGLSMDGAVQQVARRTEGILSMEFQRLQSEIASGASRRDALVTLASRSQSQSLSTFCTTIIQADKMGMSIASTLRTLVETMRTQRRQAAETAARKAPLKMLPFLVFFMIPSLFIVILGPAVLAIMEFFGDMGAR